MTRGWAVQTDVTPAAPSVRRSLTRAGKPTGSLTKASQERAARKASSSAWLAAPSIGPCRVTASAPLAAA